MKLPGGLNRAVQRLQELHTALLSILHVAPPLGLWDLSTVHLRCCTQHYGEAVCRPSKGAVFSPSKRFVCIPFEGAALSSSKGTAHI